MKNLAILLLAFLCAFSAKAQSYGWMEVDGNRVELKYAHINMEESDEDHPFVIYSDVDISRVIDNSGIKLQGVCSALTLQYNRNPSEHSNPVWESLFVFNAPVGLIGEDEISVKDYPMNCLAGEIDNDYIKATFTNGKLSASAKDAPGLIFIKGRTEGLELPCKVSFSVNGLPDNWKALMK